MAQASPQSPQQSNLLQTGQAAVLLQRSALYQQQSSPHSCTGLHPRKATRLVPFACQAQQRNSQNKLIPGSTTSGWCCRGCGRSTDSTSGTSTDSLPRRGWRCDASLASLACWGFRRSFRLLPEHGTYYSNPSSERPCPPARSLSWWFN